MILAMRDGEWFLAAFAPHIQGCNLSSVREPIAQRDKFHLWRDLIYVQSHAPLDGIIFYPDLFYHGLSVAPQMWHTETIEPILCCQAMPQEGDLDDPYFVTLLKDSQRDHYGNRLLADGWTRTDKFVYEKYIHIDDLEKAEGPPPNGSFRSG